MTQAFRIVQHIFTLSTVWLSRLAAWLWPQKHLHTDRFATDQETKRLARDTSLGLVLGLDRHGQMLSVEATPERPHLGHLAIFGPTGAGKTRREIQQLTQWKGSVIANDPKCDLSEATAEIRKKFSTVYFFAPSEGKGHTLDPIRVYLRIFWPVGPISENLELLVIPGFRDGTLGLRTTRTALSRHVCPRSLGWNRERTETL